MAPLLEAKGIAKYFGAITALHDVNFHVDHGEVLGAGKPSRLIGFAEGLGNERAAHAMARSHHQASWSYV